MRKQSIAVIEGSKAFQKFLQRERTRFSVAPVLLLTSQPDAQQGRPDKGVEDACRYTTFLFQQQMGFRTVVSHPASGYVFPTVADLDNALELAGRIGASTVAAVGSGGVIDLAKAVHQSGSHSIDELVLIPSTFSATLAAASSRSLLLDPAEETLLASPSKMCAQPAARTIAFVDSRSNCSGRVLEAIYTILALDLDSLLRGDSTERTLKRISETMKLLETRQESLHLAEIHSLLLQVGQNINYDSEGSPRSLPLALAASLIPNNFPQYGILSFLASLAEAVFEELGREGLTNKIKNIEARHFEAAPKVLGTVSSEEVLTKVHQNQAIWGCRDFSDDVLRRALRHHVV